MKWFHLLLIATVAFGFNACQKHPASDLKLIEESKEESAKKAEAKSPAESAKPAENSPAPKFFPDAK